MSARRLALTFALLAASCDDAPTEIRAENACIPDAAGDAWTLDEALERGPYAVGSHEFTFVDDTRSTPAHGSNPGSSVRSLLTLVWYPATTDGVDAAPSTAGPFPVVLYSHGFASNRSENVNLGAFLASHGYVVVAPRFPSSSIDTEGGPTGIDIAEQPRDLSFLLDRVIALSANADPNLAGTVDANRVAAVGLSFGGLTTLLVTYHATLRDPRIDVAVGLAPVSSPMLPSFYETTTTPILVMHGDSDAILPYVDHAVAFRENAHAPRTLVSLERGTHTGFTQIASLFDGTPGYEHIDSLGCEFLMIPPDSPPEPFELVDTLGGASAGIANPMSVGALCPSDMGVGMGPIRQLALENATVRAQLDAYLAPDATTRGRACHFVERVLPREPDVSVDRR